MDISGNEFRKVETIKPILVKVSRDGSFEMSQENFSLTLKSRIAT